MNKIVKVIIPIISFIVFFTLLPKSELNQVQSINTKPSYSILIPANIQSILDKSCVGCHSSDSKNFKGKMKLNLDHFTDGKYSKGKLIAKLRGMAKVLTKKSMPPKKFRAKYPDKVLTAQENSVLLDWVKVQGHDLMTK